jgi:hypothetical protein
MVMGGDTSSFGKTRFFGITALEVCGIKADGCSPRLRLVFEDVNNPEGFSFVYIVLNVPSDSGYEDGTRCTAVDSFGPLCESGTIPIGR